MIGTETLIGGNNTLENWTWFLDTIGAQYKVGASHSECKNELENWKWFLDTIGTQYTGCSHSECKNEYEEKDMIILRVSSNVLVSDYCGIDSGMVRYGIARTKDSIDICFSEKTHEFVGIQVDV